MSRQRQAARSEEVRRQIIDIAKEIMAAEGVEALSVRRITQRMEYSPGILYHYFADMDELLDCILLEGYQKIRDCVARPAGSDLPEDDPGLQQSTLPEVAVPPQEAVPPEEAIRCSFRAYIQNALEEGPSYRALMTSQRQRILAFTSVLEEGKVEERPALMAVAKAIQAGTAAGQFASCDAQLTAQAVWSAVFGLTLRLIIEDVSPQQRERLIDRELELIIRGLRK